MKKKIILIFVCRGFLLWLLAGALTGMISFKPTIPLETIQNNEELAQEYGEISTAMVIKTSVLWAIGGAIVGFLIWAIFTHRPVYEYGVMMHSFIPDPPGQGPKTLAEVKTMPLAMILGLIVGGLIHYFVLPFAVTSEMLRINPSKVPMIIACVQTMILTILILPFSLKKIEKLDKMGKISPY